MQANERDSAISINAIEVDMPMNQYAGRTSFGLLPEPEGRSGSFITATVINLSILAVVLYIGMMAKHVIEQHKYEQTALVFPTTPPPDR